MMRRARAAFRQSWVSQEESEESPERRGESPEHHVMRERGEAGSRQKDGHRKTMRRTSEDDPDSRPGLLNLHLDEELEDSDDDVPIARGRPLPPLEDSDEEPIARGRHRKKAVSNPRQVKSRNMGEYSEIIKTFGPETSLEDARASTKKWEGFSWNQGPSASGYVSLLCCSHDPCQRKLKLQYLRNGDKFNSFGAVLLGNGKAHGLAFSGEPFGGKSIGGEFVDEVKMLSNGFGPRGILAQMVFKYETCPETKDLLKLARLPSVEKIVSFVQQQKSSGSGLMTNVALTQLIGPMIVRDLPEVLLRGPNETLVTNSMFRVVNIPVYDDDGEETGKTREETTLACVVSSKTLMLFLRDLVVSLEEQPRHFVWIVGADGTYKLSRGVTASGAVLIDVVIHDITYKASIDKDVHNTLPILYCYCQIECFEVYEFLFKTLKDLPNTHLGLPGKQITPDFGSLDRASYIAKAFLAVWPEAAQEETADELD
jgi:hypothetical protein